MKSIQIREITTTGKASVVVINPYFVRNLVFNLIKLQQIKKFVNSTLRCDENGKPIFAEGETMWIPTDMMEDIYSRILPFFEELDNAITTGEKEA